MSQTLDLTEEFQKLKKEVDILPKEVKVLILTLLIFLATIFLIVIFLIFYYYSRRVSFIADVNYTDPEFRDFLKREEEELESLRRADRVKKKQEKKESSDQIRAERRKVRSRSKTVSHENKSKGPVVEPKLIIDKWRQNIRNKGTLPDDKKRQISVRSVNQSTGIKAVILEADDLKSNNQKSNGQDVIDNDNDGNDNEEDEDPDAPNEEDAAEDDGSDTCNSEGNDQIIDMENEVLQNTNEADFDIDEDDGGEAEESEDADIREHTESFMTLDGSDYMYTKTLTDSDDDDVFLAYDEVDDYGDHGCDHDDFDFHEDYSCDDDDMFIDPILLGE